MRRYRESGVVLLGKTNTPEFGITGTTESERLGPCRNPWNPDHIAGGSSGGSAGAVAAGIVPMAHASDGLGSIRIPAACCGLVGLKMTRDRNPDLPERLRLRLGFGGRPRGHPHACATAPPCSTSPAVPTRPPYPAPPKARPYLEEIDARPGA